MMAPTGVSVTPALSVDLGQYEEACRASGGEGSYCPTPVLLKGRCDEHGQIRYRWARCGRRECPSCGPEKRRIQARRIAHGISKNWPAALVVLTFRPNEAPDDGPVTEEHKAYAVRQVGRFIEKLRRLLPNLEYCQTWELHESSALHVNLVLAPWDRVPQAVLEALWGGRRLSVSWVIDERQAANEAHKRRRDKSPDGLGAYLTKISQAVERGRSISFSRGWPKLPKPSRETVGKLRWRMVREGTADRADVLELSDAGLLFWTGRPHEVVDVMTVSSLSNLPATVEELRSALCTCFDLVFDQKWWDRHFDQKWWDRQLEQYFVAVVMLD